MIKNLIKKFALLGAFVSLTVSSAWAAEPDENVTLMASETAPAITTTTTALKWTVTKNDTAAERLDVKVERLVDSTAKVTITANGMEAGEKTAVLGLYGDDFLVKTINVTIAAKKDVEAFEQHVAIGETWTRTTVTKKTANNQSWRFNVNSKSYKPTDSKYSTISALATYFEATVKENADGTATASIKGVAPADGKTFIIDLQYGRDTSYTTVQTITVVVDPAVADIMIPLNGSFGTNGTYGTSTSESQRHWVYNDLTVSGVVGLSLKKGNDQNFTISNFSAPKGYETYTKQTDWYHTFKATLTGDKVGADTVYIGRFYDGKDFVSECYKYNVYVYEEKGDSITTLKAGDELDDKTFTSEIAGAWEASSSDPTIVTVTEAGWPANEFTPVITAKAAGSAKLTIKNNFVVYTVDVTVQTGTETKDISLAKGTSYTETITGTGIPASDDGGIATISLNDNTVTIAGIAPGDAVCTIGDAYKYNVTVYSTATNDALVALNEATTIDCVSVKAAAWTAEVIGAQDVVQLGNTYGEPSTSFKLSLTGLKKDGTTKVRVWNAYAEYVFNVTVSGDVKNIQLSLEKGKAATTNLTYTSSMFWTAEEDSGEGVALVTVGAGKASSTTATVTADKAGDAKWTVYVGSSAGEKTSAAYTINVKAYETHPEAKLPLVQAGKTFVTNLTSASAASWTAESSDTGVATVTASGVISTSFELTVTGVADGDATITVWNDYARYTFTVTVVTIHPVDVPTASSGLAYTGLEQTGIPTGAGYTITGNVGTNAGGYTATAKLVDGYCWTGGDTTDKTIGWSIAQKAVTVTGDSTSKVYGAVDPTFTATVAGTNGFDGATIVYSVSRTNDCEDVGTYEIVPTGDADQVNYLVSFVPGTFEITRKPIDKPTAKTDLVYTGGCVTGVVAATGFAVADNAATNAGTYTATATLDGNHKWSDDSTAAATVDFTIVPAKITVTADDKTVKEKDPAPEYTYTVTPELFGNDKLEGSLACDYDPETAKTGSTFDILQGSLTNANYTIETYNKGVLTVASLFLTFEPAGKVYDGQELPTNEIKFVVKNNEGKEVTDFLVEGPETMLNASNYEFKVTSGNLEGTAYFTVSQALATVSAVSTNKVYSGDSATDPNPLTAAVTGLVNGESEELIKYTVTRDEGENVGTYDITASGDASQGNYKVTYVSGEFKITPKGVTVTAVDAEKVYGTPDPAFTVTSDGLVDGDSVTNAFTRTPASEDVGDDYVLTPTGDERQGNYTVTYVPGTFKITPATATVTAVSTNKLVGADDPDPLPTTVTGLVGEDKLVYTVTREAGETNGTYVITAAGEATQVGGNYKVSYVPGVFTIRTGALTVTTNGVTRGYDDLDVALDDFERYGGTAVLYGDLGGRQITLPENGIVQSEKQLTIEDAFKAPAPYFRIAETEIAGEWSYALTKLTPVEVPTAVDGLEYNGSAQTGVVGKTGFTLTGNVATNVGAYEACATLTAGYCWIDDTTRPTNIAWSIALRPAIVTAVSTNKLFGTEDPEFTTTVTGLIDTDKATLKWKAWRTNTCEDVGTYDLLVVTGEVVQASYSITYVNGTFEIKAGAMTVTTNGVSRDYNDFSAALAAMTAAGSGTAFFNKDVTVGGSTFAKGSTLTVNADGSWSTDGTLTLAGPIPVGSEVTASNVVLAANVTVGATEEETDELAVLTFRELDIGDYRLALTTNGVVRSLSATPLVDTNDFTSVTNVFDVPPAHEIVETAITGGYEYTLKMIGYVLTFDSTGGSAVKPIIAVAGEPISAPTPDPTKTGYAFVDWYTNGATTAYVFTKMPAEDFTLYAHWTANDYKVAYDPNGGEGQTVTNDATYDAEFAVSTNLFTRTGYTFAGWTTNLSSAVKFQPSDSVSNLTAKAGATVTMYATWDANGYTLTYAAGEGTGTNVEFDLTYDAEHTVIGKPDHFAKTGYSFAGWADGEDAVVTHLPGDVVSNLTAMADGVVTWTAVWTANVYQITFDAKGGTSVETITAACDAPITKPADPTKTGYTFGDWTTNGVTVAFPATMPAGGLALTATWTANTYKVKYDANGGTGEPATSNATYDAAFAISGNPGFTKTGYTFESWTNAEGTVFSFGTVTNNLTATKDGSVDLYANWTPNAYTLTYKAGEGTGDDIVSNMVYDVEYEVADCMFAKTGYSFKEWTNEVGAAYLPGQAITNLTDEPNGNVDFTAVWTGNVYQVTFDSAGGSTVDPIGAPCGEQVEAPSTVPTKAGYTFAAWTTNGVAVAWPIVMPIGGLTVTAQWTPNDYVLTFESNGGSEVSEIKAKFGEAISAPQDPTRTWYEFDGWTTNGVKVVSFPTTMPGEDLTFVAQWTAAPGNPENPWSIGPDGSDAVEAYVDPDLGRVVIRLNETNEIDLVALTNALVQAKVEINLDNFNAVVEVVDGTYMTPVSWSDTVDEKEPYPTLGDALKGATRFVCPNLSEEEPPAEIVEKRKTEDGETVTAVVVNDPSGGEANPIQVTAVTGLAEIAEEQKEDVTLRVAATNENTVGEATVWALMFANTNGLENVDGYQASYVDLSAKIGNAQVSDLGEGNVVTLFIPWTVDSRFIYRIARIHDGEPETIPEGKANKNEFGEYFEFVEGGIGLNVRRFSTYALAEIVAEQSGVAFIEVDDADTGVREGTNLVIRVTGGNRDFSSSVQLQVVYGTAASSDFDLKNTKVNGAVVSGFKFPYALTWARGALDEQTIEIPVKVPSKAKAERDLTFELQNPMNLKLEGVDRLVANKSFRKVKILGSGSVSGKVYVRATPNDATRGKASGSALVAEGKKVTVKATANKGYVFTGWFKGEELREKAASYAFTPTADIDLVARFEPLAADYLELKDDFLPAEIKLGEVFSNAVTITSGSLPTISVSGLPAGLKYYAKETVVKKTSKTPEYTVPANTIFGIPTKASATNKTSGVVTPSKVKVTVKNLGGYKVVRTYELRVTAQTTALGSAKVIGDDKPFAAVTVALSDDAAGKVTGAGLYQAGKKVTLKATANKGYVFAEWLEDGVNVSSNASYVIASMPSNNVSLVAKFVLPDEIKDPTGKNPYAVAVVRNNDFAGNVTGAGYYQAGKKVTLKATALKGYVFAGWATDDFTVTNQAASLTFTMGTEKVRAYARFVTAGEDLASIVTAANGTELFVTEKGVACLATNVMCGVDLRWPVAASALSLPKVSVSGLPNGLKFTAKPVTAKVNGVTVTNVPANTIYGAPTAASKPGKPSKVKVTVTTSGKSKAEYQIDLTVDELPAYAVGTFDGPVFAADGTTNGVVKLTVAKNGKISGTIQTNCVNAAAKKLTLSVASFANYDLVTGVFTLAPTYKDGKATVELPMTLAGAEVEEGVTNGVVAVADESLVAYQNVLKGATKEDFDAPDLSATYPNLTLTVAKDGVLKVAGKVDGVSVSGSSQIYYDADEAGYRAVIYLPSKKGFDGVAEIIAVIENIPQTE